MPYKDIEKKREHQKDWYASHKEKGLCIRCNRKAILGFTECAEHLYKHILKQEKYRKKHRQTLIKKQREWRDKMRQENRCVRCSAPLMEEENGRCMNCSMNLWRRYPIKNMRGAI